jgi:hypothetical protein
MVPLLAAGLVLCMAAEGRAQLARPDYGQRLGMQWQGDTSFRPQGPQVSLGAIDPSRMRWYMPQELVDEYSWRQWETSNFTHTTYGRYVPQSLEGDLYYDMYGNEITRGWLMYNSSQSTPEEFGNTLFQSRRFDRWFNGVVIAADSKGGTFGSLTVSNSLRTSLTPLVLSKVQLDGMQFDLATDKYQTMMVFSRLSGPKGTFDRDNRRTNSTTLFGGRFITSVGDFVEMGVHGITAHQSNSKLSEAPIASLAKGRLTEDQNALPISTIELVLGDDSPADGTGGAVFFPASSDIVITYEDGAVDRGKDIGFEPLLLGGASQAGTIVADGNEEIRLIYSFDDPGFVNRASNAKDEIVKVEFELTVANDYHVSMSSDRQRNNAGARAFIPVAVADGNVKDLSNLRVLRFEYGLPTAVQIMGGTIRLNDVLGFRMYGEYDRSWNLRQYPNASQEIHRTSSGLTDSPHGDAWMLNVSNQHGRLFGFAEFYRIEPQYSTTTYISDQNGFIDYESSRSLVDLVEDNDDQDRFPDALRGDWQAPDVLIFPGWDRNGDFQPDFNQNDNDVRRNSIPDYEEPFQRFWVDRPEMLWGRDMNNNFWPDLYENDDDPDYPYGKDHKGYNVYGGLHLVEGMRVMGGVLREELISSDQKNHAVYGMFDYDRTWPSYGRLRVYESAKVVEDDIADDLLQYAPDSVIDLAESQESKVPMADPLLARDTFVNQFFAGHQINTERVLLESKINHVIFHQRMGRAERRRFGLKSNEFFTGVVNKALYRYELGRVDLQPFWKSEYRKQSRGLFEVENVQTLTEIFGGFAILDVLSSTQLQLGTEFLFQKGFGDQDNFNSQSIAGQVTNWSSYQGYVLTMQSGILVERRAPEGEDSFTNIRAYLSVFAGLDLGRGGARR